MLNVLNFFANGGYGRAQMERQKQEAAGEVLNNKVGNYMIDSCYTFDAGYETAIWYDSNPMVIVEYYSSKESMAIGHKKWCEFCKKNPKKVYSVQFYEEIDLV